MTYYLYRLLCHPLLLALAFAAILVPLRKAADGARVHLGGLTPPLSAAAILGYIGVLVWYSHGPYFVDHGEPLTVCVAWAYLHGQPIYHTADAAARYTLAYGPLGYLIEGAWLRLVGPNLDWVKVPAILASILSVAAVAFIAARDGGGWRRALPLSGLFCLVLLEFRPFAAFWTRPDPFLLLITALATIVAEKFPRRSGMLLFGSLLGLAPLLKIFSVVYFLPLIPLAWRRWGIGALFLIALLAAAVFALPFALLPRISFRNHLYWIAMARHQGFDWVMLRFNIEYAAYFLIPLVTLAVWGRPKIPRLEWLGLSFAMAAAVMFGSKMGGAWYYLMPLTPILVMMGTRPHEETLPAWTRPAWASFILASVCMAVLGCVLVAQVIRQQANASGEAKEIEADLRDDPHAWMAMGSENFIPGDPATMGVYLRPLLIFAGSPIGIDPTSMVDITKEHIPIPKATLEALDNGEYAYWLFPAGEAPFMGFPYPAVLRDHFIQHYKLLKQGTYYEVWAYKPARAAHSSL